MKNPMKITLFLFPLLRLKQVGYWYFLIIRKKQGYLKYTIS